MTTTVHYDDSDATNKDNWQLLHLLTPFGTQTREQLMAVPVIGFYFSGQSFGTDKTDRHLLHWRINVVFKLPNSRTEHSAVVEIVKSNPAVFPQWGNRAQIMCIIVYDADDVYGNLIKTSGGSLNHTLYLTSQVVRPSIASPV